MHLKRNALIVIFALAIGTLAAYFGLREPIPVVAESKVMPNVVESRKGTTNPAVSKDAGAKDGGQAMQPTVETRRVPEQGSLVPTPMRESRSDWTSRLARGTQLKALLDEVSGSKDPAAPWIAAEIAMHCSTMLRYIRNSHSVEDPQRRDLQSRAKEVLAASCAGIDYSHSVTSQYNAQRRAALENGAPVAMAHEVLMLKDKAPGDAFDIATTLLKSNGAQPEIWRLIDLLPTFGIAIGADDPVLRRATPTQRYAALDLVYCAQTTTCNFETSIQLQRSCLINGMCAQTMHDYVRDYVLPAEDYANLAPITARMSDLITRRQWSVLGYDPANRPAQSGPSVIRKPAAPPPK